MISKPPRFAACYAKASQAKKATQGILPVFIFAGLCPAKLWRSRMVAAERYSRCSTKAKFVLAL